MPSSAKPRFVDWGGGRKLEEFYFSSANELKRRTPKGYVEAAKRAE